jgi:hypothetical protein
MAADIIVFLHCSAALSLGFATYCIDLIRRMTNNPAMSKYIASLRNGNAISA